MPASGLQNSWLGVLHAGGMGVRRKERKESRGCVSLRGKVLRKKQCFVRRTRPTMTSMNTVRKTAVDDSRPWTHHDRQSPVHKYLLLSL